jgi:hypothetical protein
MFLVGHTFTICDLFYGGIENKSYLKNCQKQKHWKEIMEAVKCLVEEINQEYLLDWSWLDKIFSYQR